MINEAWLSYAAEVIPANAPEGKYPESRHAFYAGARAAFDGIVTTMAGAGSDANNLAMMETLQDELRKFAQDVVDGKA